MAGRHLLCQFKVALDFGEIPFYFGGRVMAVYVQEILGPEIWLVLPDCLSRLLVTHSIRMLQLF